MWKIENDEDSAGGAVFVCKENPSTRLDDVLFRTYDEPLAEVVVDALNVHEVTGLTPSQLQARVAELGAALRPALEFVETFSNRWDGQRGRHPWGVVQDARKALGVE